MKKEPTTEDKLSIAAIIVSIVYYTVQTIKAIVELSR